MVRSELKWFNCTVVDQDFSGLQMKKRVFLLLEVEVSLYPQFLRCVRRDTLLISELKVSISCVPPWFNLLFQYENELFTTAKPRLGKGHSVSVRSCALCLAS